MTRRPTYLAIALALLAGAAVAPGALAAKAAPHTVSDGCIASVPEPRSSAPTKICYSLFRPAGASAARPVPMIMHGHGWGGSRTRDVEAFRPYLDDGYGVLSFDQRGFGESGGRAHTLQPDIEGQDVIRLVDTITRLPWVKKERPGDPVLGAIGGSYGGGYQFLGAFTELRDRGRTRFDALTPQITWNDLKQALAPDEVARSTWLTLLTGVSVQDNDERATRSFVLGGATGLWPGQDNPVPDTDMDAYFEKTGPSWHVAQGRRLDIPVLIGQGISDNLFNLNEAVRNFDTALTPAARRTSMLVGYNGGHVLPNALPRAAATAGDPCSKKLGGSDFAALSRRFFAEHLQGGKGIRAGHGQYHLATMDATRCITVDRVTPTKGFPLGTIATTVGAGAPVAYEIAAGPLSVAGVPRVDATVTSAGVFNKAFFALSVGTSPATAVVVQNNVMPLNEEMPLTATARSIELPGVAVDVPEGQKLFLTVSPVSDMFVGHGSRTPGGLVLRDTVVQVPVVKR
jgi:ABC-2 type transport system ATP-binding protein